jgi:hypothetical protein
MRHHSSPRTPARGEGLGLQHANWATAILHNGLGRYDEAWPAAEQAAEEDYAPFITACALPELIEAAARSGQNALAADALRRLSATTSIQGADWAAGLEARSRALLSQGHAAECCYTEAIQRLARTPLWPDLARAHLLYGEWLRREGRRVDARHQLHTAHDLFTAMGAEAFAERARRELLATGEKVRKRQVDARTELTPQEEHIARLARNGRTNSEIAAELSSAPAPSNGTSARCSPNSGSPRERDSTTPWPSMTGTRHTTGTYWRTDHRNTVCPRRPLEGATTLDATTTVLTVAAPVAIFVLALYGVGSVFLRQRDPFHLLLLAGTAGVLVLAVACAELGMSVSWCLAVRTGAVRHGARL